MIVGLNEGLTGEDIGDLLDSVAGVIARDRSDRALPSVDVRVPPRTEKSAILTALADSRTRFATLDILGPAVP